MKNKLSFFRFFSEALELVRSFVCPYLDAHHLIFFLFLSLQKIGCRLKIFSNIAPQSTDRIAQIIGKEEQCIECLMEIVDLLKTVRELAQEHEDILRLMIFLPSCSNRRLSKARFTTMILITSMTCTPMSMAVTAAE